MFSWDGVEQDEWEDTDFLKECEEKGVTIDLKDSDAKAIELKFDSGEKHGRDVKLLRKAEFVSSSISRPKKSIRSRTEGSTEPFSLKTWDFLRRI